MFHKGSLNRSSYSVLRTKAKLKSIAEHYVERSLILCYKYMHGIRTMHRLITVAINNSKYDLRIAAPHCLQIIIMQFRLCMCDSIQIFRLFHLWNNIPSISIVESRYSQFRAKAHSYFENIVNKVNFMNAFREM